MNFKEVNELEIPARGKKKLQIFIEEFSNSNIRAAVIQYSEDEYKNPKSCHSSIWAAVKKSRKPIKVQFVDGLVYLINLACEEGQDR